MIVLQAPPKTAEMSVKKESPPSQTGEGEAKEATSFKELLNKEKPKEASKSEEKGRKGEKEEKKEISLKELEEKMATDEENSPKESLLVKVQSKKELKLNFLKKEGKEEKITVKELIHSLKEKIEEDGFSSKEEKEEAEKLLTYLLNNSEQFPPETKIVMEEVEGDNSFDSLLVGQNRTLEKLDKSEKKSSDLPFDAEVIDLRKGKEKGESESMNSFSNAEKKEDSFTDKVSFDKEELTLQEQKQLTRELSPETNSSEKQSSTTTETVKLEMNLVEASNNDKKLMSESPIKTALDNLQAKLKESGENSEIVKGVRFLLKDQNSGEIQLRLRPDSLGEVRIRINLSQNYLAGKIIVENSNVQRIFINNIDSLSQALEESGYEGVDLNVTYDGENQTGEEQAKEGEEKKDSTIPFFSQRIKEVENSSFQFENSNNNHLDMVV